MFLYNVGVYTLVDVFFGLKNTLVFDPWQGSQIRLPSLTKIQEHFKQHLFFVALFKGSGLLFSDLSVCFAFWYALLFSISQLDIVPGIFG